MWNLCILGELYRSEGLPRTGYSIPVRDGVGVGDVGKFFRRRRRRRPPQKWLFFGYNFLREWGLG